MYFIENMVEVKTRESNRPNFLVYRFLLISTLHFSFTITIKCKIKGHGLKIKVKASFMCNVFSKINVALYLN